MDKESAQIRRRGLRRTMSLSTTEKVLKEEKMYQSSRVDHPIHRHADSLFSTSSGFSDFRGFFNLAVLLLVLSSARVALENAIKYGILVDPLLLLQLFISNPHGLPNLLIVLSYNCFILFAYIIERLLASETISENVGRVFLIINLAMELLTPCYVILVKHPNPFYSSVSLLIGVIVFLKLISYKQTLKWCRDNNVNQKKRRGVKSRDRYKSVSVAKNNTVNNIQDVITDGEQVKKLQHRNGVRRLSSIPDGDQGVVLSNGRTAGFLNGVNGHIMDTSAADVLATNVYSSSEKKVQYPDNLSVKDLYFFMVIPTLCYELSFPLSQRTRKRFLLKRISEVVFISGLIIALIQQWVLPLINNALVPFSEMQLPMMLERILKLALPNFCIWLLWFYVTFHSMFNVLAELSKFGDRVFYEDWWNAESVTEFWKKWNVPVHRWAVRHLYKPLLLRGYSKIQCALAVFFLSAFFHEVLVSVPLGLFRLYAFMGMILQVPLAIVTDKMRHTSPKMCNVVVWLSLIIGQPIAVLMYCVDYYIVMHRAN